jgi:hypothetical protein
LKLPRNVVSLALLLLAGVAGTVVPALYAQKTQKPARTQTQKVESMPPRIWKSESSLNEYRVWIRNKTLHADWVNIPTEAAKSGAYIRTTCRLVGDKWVGTSRIYMPCSVERGPVVNRCHLVMRMEIDEITADHIAGRVEDPKRDKFDCKTCNATEKVWKRFVWVPKKQEGSSGGPK